MPKLDALGFVGILLIVVGILWQMVVAWREGAFDPNITESQQNPLVAIVDFFMALSTNSLGNPRRLGFVFIGIGALLLIVDLLIAKA